MKDVYVITGATGGMGEDFALNATKKGILLLVDLDADKLKKLKAKLTRRKIKSETLVCDISNIDDIRNLVSKVSELGHLKALIHTAGISESMGSVEDILKVNLVGTKLLLDEIYEIADNSEIILISSMTGHMVPDSFLYNKLLLNPLDKNFIRKMKIFAKDSTAAYAFSKKGVIMLVEKEVSKWAEKNSRIVSVSPGAIETPLLKLENENNPAVSYMVKNTPIPRFGKPREITEVISYLIGDGDTFITGVDILIDGGITAHMKYNDIFGLKKDYKPIIVSTLLYIFTFLLFPLMFGLFYDSIILCSIQESLLFFVNPAAVILITAFNTKNKMSHYLIFAPAIICVIASLINYGDPNWYCAIYYSLFATVTNLFKVSYNQTKRSEK